jgi:hypothetical protein
MPSSEIFGALKLPFSYFTISNQFDVLKIFGIIRKGFTRPASWHSAA